MEENVLQTGKEKRSFTKGERLLCWGTLLLGYIFCRAWPADTFPLGALLFCWGLFALSLLFLKKQARGRGLFFFGAELILSFSFLVTENSLLQRWTLAVCLLLWAYGVYASSGNSEEERVGELFPLELIKAAVFMPFASLGQFLRAVSSGEKGKRSVGRTLLYILLGIALALIPTVIIAVLLSYDQAFSDLFNKLVTGKYADQVLTRLISFFFGVPVAAVLFSLFLSNKDHRCSKLLPVAGYQKVLRIVRFAPQPMAFAALTPVLLLYALFFVSQWSIYTAAFTGVLPEGFSFSQYAREGFFELCTVCAINAALLAALCLFTKRSGEKPGLLQRIFTGLLCLMTMLLCVTALSKMFLYIGVYGMTPKRFYATWGMLLLLLSFLLALLSQFMKKLNLIRGLGLLFLVLFGVLTLSNPDRQIARYNVEGYLSGALPRIDTAALEDLGEAAVPEIEKLTDCGVYAYEKWSAEQLTNYASDLKPIKNNFLSFSIPRYRARAIVKDWKLE